MGSGSTRPNNADDKMIAAIERGDRDELKIVTPLKIRIKNSSKKKKPEQKKPGKNPPG